MVDKKTGLKPKKEASKKPKVETPEVDKGSINKTVKETIQTKNEPAELAKEDKTTKAGKHSAKSKKEADEKQAKEDRKASAKVASDQAKKPVKPARSREERAGKNYREASKLIDKSRLYPVNEAIELLLKTASTKFDSTAELHVNLEVDPKQADQNVRGTVVLPEGTGKIMRVAVYAEGEDIKIAKEAGADIAKGDDLLAALDSEKIDFDILITSPNLMAKLAKYARVLGPKGLMPNPKSGTVTTDIKKSVSEAKAGRLEYRVDPAGILHMPIGKVSFGEQKLKNNFDITYSSIRSAKPVSVKGVYIKSAYLTTTMGPSIKLEV